MKDRINRLINEYKWLFIMLTISSLVIFGIFIIGNRPYKLFGDHEIQYNIFYREWVRLVREFIQGNGLPMYSWNSFLGADFFGSQAYYSTGDIFLPILLLFKNTEKALLLESVLCIYIAGITMNMYLKEYGIKNQFNRNYIALIYAICGWATFIIGNYMFHRFYAFFPLLIYGMERYINKKNPSVFILTTTILFLQCYYFMFPASVFVLIYGVFTTMNKEMKWKEILFVGFKMIVFYIIGFMMSTFLIFPAIYATLTNPRVGSMSYSDIFWQFKVYIGFVMHLFMPNYSGYPNAFQGLENFADSGYSLFIGIIPLLSCISVLRKKQYKNYLFTLCIFIAAFLIMPLSSMMQGFSEPTLRWGFMMVFFILLISAIGLEELNVKKTGKIYAVLMGLWVFSTLIAFITDVLSNVNCPQIIHIVIAMIIMNIIYFISRKDQKIGLYLVVLQLVGYGAFGLYYTNREYYVYEETINRSYIEEYQLSDADLMFRYYVDYRHLLPTHDLNFNKSLDYGYMGVSAYNSLYDATNVEFLHLNNLYYHHLNLTNPDIMTMLGVKYYIVYDECELPNDYHFTYAYNLDHLMVYEMEEFKGFGYTTNNVRYLDELQSLKEMMDTVFVDDPTIDISDYHDIKSSSLNIYEKGNNHLKANIYSETKNILQIPIPNNKGWKVLLNGEQIETISVNGGFMGITIYEGDNHIEMYFMSYGFKEGLILSSVGMLMFVCIVMYGKKYIKN